MTVSRNFKRTQLQQASVPVPTRQRPSGFDALPDAAWVRQSQLVRNPSRPDAPVLLPFSSATLWRKVRDGSFPQPTSFGAGGPGPGGRITAWRVGDIRAWLAEQQVGSAE